MQFSRKRKVSGEWDHEPITVEPAHAPGSVLQLVKIAKLISERRIFIAFNYSEQAGPPTTAARQTSLYLRMNVRRFQPLTDYSTLARWSSQQGIPLVPLELLSIYGVIAEHEGQPLVVAWLYPFRDVPVGMFETMVGDPTADSELRGTAIGACLAGMEDLAKELNLKAIYAVSKKPRVVAHLRKLGFTEMEPGMVNFYKALETK